MDSPQISSPQASQGLPQSASSSDTNSPALSLFSKGHTTRPGSSASSVASSPALGDSFDLFVSSKRLLTDVKEEPTEREDANMTDDLPSRLSANEPRPGEEQATQDQSIFNLAGADHYNFNEDDEPDFQLSTTASFKRRRAGDSPASIGGGGSRTGTRFPSFSRKWKNKTGAGPKLSIVTHYDTMRSPTSSTSTQLVSPALSAISPHENVRSPARLPAMPGERSGEVGPSALEIEEAIQHAEEDREHATTPLLPPLLMELSPDKVSLQSPLQSPTVADTSSRQSSVTPCGTPQLSSLPSPPLSTKPSIASIRQRSRAGTVVHSSDTPSLQMLGECNEDEWCAKLGHANFAIHPEPYVPDVFDMENFKQWRENWDQARRSYAKHLARTGEHYGTTSKTYLLTEEKWTSIDAEWNKINATITGAVESRFARSSGGESEISDPAGSSSGLEQPPSKVTVPMINDPSGKFPDMGDEDIVGPMTVGPSRSPNVHPMVEPVMQSRLSKKRTFFRFISDILGGRGVSSGLRT